MAKPKKKFSRKALLKEPEIIESFMDRATEWVRNNQRTATVTATAVLVAVALLVGIHKYNVHRESQAMALWGGAQDTVAQLAADANAKEAAQALKALKSVADQYPRTKAAVYAELERANLLYQEGKPAEAAKLYEGALPQFKPGDLLGLLAKEGLGYCRLASGDLAGAQKVFGELTASTMTAGTANLNLGLIYERQGKSKEALAAYQKAAMEASGAEASLAHARIEALSPAAAPGA